MAAEGYVELGEALAAEIVDRDVGAHADRDLRGIDPGDAAAEDRDLGGSYARHAAQQHTASALFLLRVMGADLDR